MGPSRHLPGIFVLLSCATPGVAQTVIAEWTGAAVGDGLGFAVAFLGDANGDGFDDWLVGSPASDGAGDASGRVLLVSGLDNTVLWALDGPGLQEGFGYALATLGDVDADGVPDAVVGASIASPNGFLSGSAYVVSGVDGALIHAFHGDAAGDNFGFAVGALPDVNADGIPEVVVGAPGALGTRGLVRVFSGSDGSLLIERLGTQTDGHFGAAVAGMSDANGDGTPDLLVGAPHDTYDAPACGAAYLLSGADGSDIVVFNGDHSGGHLGSSVASAGDIDGDGLPDLMAGAPEAHADLGEVRVYSGATRARLLHLIGDSTRARMGSCLISAGDVSGDGVPDFIIGARRDYTGGTAAGAFLVYSSDGTELAEVFGTQGAYLGFSVGARGDANGDGLLDFVVGAWRGSGNRGNAFLYTFDPCPSAAPYCSPGSGPVPVIGASGPTSVSANDFTLTVSAAPPAVQGVFFYGPHAVQSPFGAGTLCVGGGRDGVQALYPAQTVLPDGTLARGLDLGSEPFTSGSALSFQFYYVDTTAGNVQRLSDALRVRFCP